MHSNLNSELKRIHAEEAFFDKTMKRWLAIISIAIFALIALIAHSVHESTTIKDNFEECKIESVHAFSVYGTTTALRCKLRDSEYRVITKMQAPIVGEVRECYEVNNGAVRCYE